MLANNAILLMQHALGKTPDARHDLMATLNRAGRKLAECHPWGWRRKTSTLVAVADQNYIELDDEFGEMLELGTASGSYGVDLIPLEDLYRLRVNAVGTVTSPLWKAALGGQKRQAGGRDKPGPILELYPTPTTAGTPTLTAYHLATWRRIRPEDTLAELDIPANFEDALLTIARLMARAIENNTDHLLPDIRALPEVQRLIDLEPRMRGAASRIANSVCIPGGYGGGPDSGLVAVLPSSP